VAPEGRGGARVAQLAERAYLAPRRVAPVLAGVIALVVYRLTMLGGVGASDVAEMETVPKVLGIAHPTGYPLWTLLGFVWTRIPLGNAALRMNFLTALYTALAAGVLVVLAMRLGVRPWLAASAGLIFAFAGETWFNAVHAEVQQLHVLLVALLLLGFVIAEQSGGERGVVLMFGAAGLGLAHHALMIVTAVPVIAWFCVRHVRVMLVPRRLATSLAVLAAPLLVVFYLPIRLAHGAPVVNANTQNGWIEILKGEGFIGSFGTRKSVSIWWHGLSVYLKLAGRWLGWFVIGLAALGIVVLALRGAAILVGLLLVILATTYALVHAPDEVRYLVAPLLVLSLLAAIAAEEVVQTVSTSLANEGARRIAAVALVCGFAVVPLVSLLTGYHGHDQSHETTDRLNAERILAALPAHAVIWSYWDIRTTLQYLHAVDGVRPDVTILDDRADAQLGGEGAYAASYDLVANAVASDPKLAGRPIAFIPYPYESPYANRTGIVRYQLRQFLVVQRPYGFDFLPDGWLYLLDPVASSASSAG